MPNEELAPSSDPFFDRLPAESKTDGTPRTDLPDHESADAYFDRLATQSPAEMSTNGAPALAVTPMPGSAMLPAELARPSRHHGRLRGRLIPPALAMRLRAAFRRSRFAWLLSTAALAALVAGIAVIGEFGSPGSERPQSQHGAIESSLEPLKPGVVAASANPFSATALVHRPVTPVRPSHPSNPGRPRSHRAGTRTSAHVQTIVNHRVVAARYTPARSTSASLRVTPDSQSGSATESTPPAAPTHYTSSSNSGSGSSSGSASPSKATLRSLVTGAGTCSCQ